MTLERNNSVVSTISNPSGTPIAVDYNLSQITPYVFVTAADTAQQFPKVFSSGIACVINVAHELPQIVFPPQSGIESLKYPIRDNPAFPVSQYFDVVADRIAANVASNRRTLLYCFHGRSRSVTFILAYLIKHHRLPLTTAFALVKDKRQVAHPNSGFWSQLMAYELYQRQQYNPQYSPIIYRNQIRNSNAYGGQMLNKIADGFQRVLAQLSIVNVFTNSIEPRYQNRNPRFQRRHIRRRPSIYSHPYHIQRPANFYPQRVF